MKEELEKILFYFQLEVQSWNIGRPIHRTLTKEEALTSMEEALTSIINLVDKVIGEDEPDETDKWTPEMDSYIRQARQVVYGRNALRAEQRAKLKGVIS